MYGDFTSFIAAGALADHSSHGEAHLTDAAYHFLIVRLYYEHMVAGPLTPERFNNLAYESWVVIIQGTLQSYHTWLGEVSAAPPTELFDSILERSRTLYLNGVAELKNDLTTHGILEGD